ncbi:MAG: NAD-dependent epimerase/dehydratase family protein [archaeon]|nr:NAD-dependent epimerase/dehydratase family protein [archaeon]
MKIGVTGSNGLVGKALIKKLKEKKFEVIECNHTNCDVTNIEQVKKSLKGANIIVHCAAKLDEHAKDLFEVNVKGTENVLEAASENRVRQFIFLSSVAVFGKSAGLKNEETTPNPETRYEKSKWEAEQMVLSYQEIFPVTIFRPAIIVGKSNYWSKIIKIIKKDFPLIGDGSNHWQLVSLENVVNAILFSIKNEDCFEETFMLCDDEAMTLKELAEFIRKESGMKKPLKRVPVFLGKIIAFINGYLKIVPLLDLDYLKRMIRDRHYSNKKIKSLGFEFKFSTKESLRKLMK